MGVNYTVTVSVNPILMPSLLNVQSLSFLTYAPPTGGTVSVSPASVFVGANVTVSISGYTSSFDQNPNATTIVWNVFSAIDASGMD